MVTSTGYGARQELHAQCLRTTGDGFLIELPSALAAVQCAIAIQHALHERNQVTPPDRQVRIRIGIHVGDVVVKDGDIHGDGVNIAARIEPLAIGGGICLSTSVFDQVRNKLDVGLTKLNSPELKHIEVPVDVYRVGLPWEQQPDHSRRCESARTPGGTGGTGSGMASQRPLTSAATKVTAIAALVLLAVGFGWWLLRPQGKATKSAGNPQKNNGPGATASATTSATDQKSIAVLPFVSMSADKADEHLSDGMTEELLNVLAQVPGLRVPGRSSCFAFKGKGCSHSLCTGQVRTRDWDRHLGRRMPEPVREVDESAHGVARASPGQRSPVLKTSATSSASGRTVKGKVCSVLAAAHLICRTR